jgi:GH15 family glucan-1,4-alpha-glucosidase
MGHQVFCIVGLAAAAELARVVGDTAHADRWTSASRRIRSAMLEHPIYRLIDGGRFIRRRLVDGSHEHAMIADASWYDADYAPYLPPAHDAMPRSCEPDVTEVLPIIYGIVDGESDVARATLEALESLWSPTGTGGYARYNIESEPDSPGPWPFASAMVASAELDACMRERAGRTLQWLLDAAGEGGSWLEYYGERESPPFPPIGIIVWGWAQFILAIVEHAAGIVVDSEHLRIRPRLAGIATTVRIAERTVGVRIEGVASATLDGDIVELVDGAVQLELPLTRDHTIVFR